MKKLFIYLLLLLTFTSSAQTVREIAALATTPRNVVDLPVDYYILSAEQGEQETFDKTFRKLTPVDVLHTQSEKLKEKNKVSVLLCQPCVLPYVQPDTQINIKFKRNLHGYWRAVSIRTLQFTDSTNNKAASFNRTSRMLNEDTSADMLISITEDNFRVYYKEAGKEKFRIITDTKYELLGKRYMLLYKNMKSSGDISLAGIDTTGKLILNTCISAQRRIPNMYNVYETITSQVVLEKLNVQHLHYKEEKKNNSVPGKRVSPN